MLPRCGPIGVRQDPALYCPCTRKNPMSPCKGTVAVRSVVVLPTLLQAGVDRVGVNCIWNGGVPRFHSITRFVPFRAMLVIRGFAALKAR